MRRLAGMLLVLGLLFGSFSLVAAQSPELEVTGPVEGATVDGTDVTVSFDVSGISIIPSTVPLEMAGQQPEANKAGEGHLHLMLDLGSVVVWNEMTPYTFADVPPGEHQLMVEIVANDHSSLNPPVVRQIQFRTTASQIMPRTGLASADQPAAEFGLLAAAGLVLLGAGLMLRRRMA